MHPLRAAITLISALALPLALFPSGWGLAVLPLSLVLILRTLSAYTFPPSA